MATKSKSFQRAAERPCEWNAALDSVAHPARLADGRDVVIRAATRRDLAGIIDFFERLNAESRSSRFFSPQPRLRRAMIERIVTDGPDRCSVLAQPADFSATARNMVAVGSWVHLPRHDRAEISIAVADAWQGVRLGSYVVRVLVRAAVAAGHRRFAVEVLGSKARMLGLFRDLGTPTRWRCEAGVVRVEFELPADSDTVGGMSAVAAVAARRDWYESGSGRRQEERP